MLCVPVMNGFEREIQRSIPRCQRHLIRIYMHRSLHGIGDGLRIPARDVKRMISDDFTKHWQWRDEVDVSLAGRLNTYYY
jgi:hypothetical protein